MASLFREDTQNMEAGGEALRGVQTADVKTVKQPVSVSAASQSWWSRQLICEVFSLSIASVDKRACMNAYRTI